MMPQSDIGVIEHRGGVQEDLKNQNSDRRRAQSHHHSQLNPHGERATTIVVGTERVLTRGKWRTLEVLACPVTWRPHPEQIASARRGYDDWWQALGWVRDGLAVGRMLREVEVTAVMLKVRPWKR